MFLPIVPAFQQRGLQGPPRVANRVVWQERYDGIASVAYQGGRAIAGISGPWSSRYVLTWWLPNPEGQLEIFDTADAAREAVERRCRATPKPVNIPAIRMPRPSWAERLFSWPWRRTRQSAASASQLRQRSLRAEADLTGLSFSATSD